jgi:hypothetical protein
MTRFTLPLLLVALLPALVSAKCIAPTKVEPVIHEGIRYVAPNDDGRRAYIEASDVQTNKRLWDLTIWANPIDPKVEEDIQWIFIKALGVRGDTLVVTSERGNTYRVDLTTRTIIQSDPERSPAPDETTQPHDIPEAIDRAITNGSLAKEYEVSVRVKPFYVRGGFNGDGKMDVAALVKQRSTGKLGIAIVHGKSDKVTILGAGTPIGNGADDFEWMDSWEIYSKNSASNGASVRKLHGDALLVSKSGAASALIYWNGKRYAWFQQGD